MALSVNFLTAFAAASISALAWIAPASATVIYDGGAPDQGGQIFSQPGVNAAAMSFSLSSDAASRIRWSRLLSLSPQVKAGIDDRLIHDQQV